MRIGLKGAARRAGQSGGKARDVTEVERLAALVAASSARLPQEVNACRKHG